MIYVLLILLVIISLVAYRLLKQTIRRYAYKVIRRINQMSEELNAAIAEQNAAIDNLSSAITAETAQIEAALAALPTEDPAVAEAVAAIRASNERLNSLSGSVSAIIPDAPPEA